MTEGMRRTICAVYI